jgi:arginine decarboxylase
MQPWQLEDTKEIYNIEHWSDGFFDVNENGHLVAFPRRNHAEAKPVDLYELVQNIQRQGLNPPILLRFPDILHTRIESLSQAFKQAIQETNYGGKYSVIYPIKVNQQRFVISEIYKHKKNTIGLEAGSKSELLGVIGVAKQPGTTIVCNGYKDVEYIRLAFIAQLLGHQVFLILEKYSELEKILTIAKQMNVVPRLGIRIRSLTSAAGKWQDSGGEKSKFGLSSTQVFKVIERLSSENSLHTLELLHFHFGSQIANISDIQNGMKECARYYAELHRLGAAIKIVDVGGGLGVDYDGTHTRRFSSVNYNMEEYANNIVYTLHEVCLTQRLPHPDIFSESGRAITAHHAVLITNVIDTETVSLPDVEGFVNDDNDFIIANLLNGIKNLTPRTALEAYHDAIYWMQEAHSKFLLNVIGLEKRARIEQLYLATCWRVREMLKPEVRAHREVIDDLNNKLADKFFLNFSLFQSLPDAWSIDHIFPILPLSQLTEQPTRRVVLQDLTCDSDGRIDYYLDGQGIESTLPLPPYQADKPYLVAVFLVGAYQEILGDMHNLFGDTASVNVVLNADGSYDIAEPKEGDLVKDVLRYVSFDSKILRLSYRQQMNRATLPINDAELYLDELLAGLNGYTYLEE